MRWIHKRQHAILGEKHKKLAHLEKPIKTGKTPGDTGKLDRYELYKRYFEKKKNGNDYREKVRPTKTKKKLT